MIFSSTPSCTKWCIWSSWCVCISESLKESCWFVHRHQGRTTYTYITLLTLSTLCFDVYITFGRSKLLHLSLSTYCMLPVVCSVSWSCGIPLLIEWLTPLTPLKSHQSCKHFFQPHQTTWLSSVCRGIRRIVTLGRKIMNLGFNHNN